MEQRVFSIGHSTHSLEKFLALLQSRKIEVVVDVRSRPYAKYAVHFNGPVLQYDLQRAGLKYLYLGKEMGGMPDDPKLQSADGGADYEKIVASEPFKEGLHRLLKGASNYRIVLMCGEENPAGCHRRNLIGWQLSLQGIDLQHIRADGNIETQSDLARGEPEKADQLRLF